MTDRIPLDHLNSDQYDELCGELERLRADARQCAAQQWPQRLARAEKALARIQALADDHPASIDTALIHAALPDRPAATQATEPAHNDGPSIREAAAADRAWPLQKAGE